MKRTIILMISLCFLALAGVSAQERNREEWKQKMMNEKIAFLTTELGITPEEGQAFWPVYNQIQKEKDAAMYNVFKAYKELSKANAEGKSAKEIEKLLEAYLSAQQKSRELEEKTAEKFMKVLPVEKVAKLYIAEERFRRKQIHRLNHGDHQKNPQK